MKTNNAIVITWVGNKSCDDLIRKIAGIMIATKTTIPELLQITVKDSDGIAKALLNDSPVMQEPNEDALTSAIVLIGKRFSDSLISTNGNYLDFTMALLIAIKDAKRYTTDENIAFLNAIKILEKTQRLPKISRMYHINPEIIGIIKNVYHAVG